VFYGIKKSFIEHSTTEKAASGEDHVVIVRNGKITCSGPCEAELASLTSSDNAITKVHLKNGHIAKPFTAFGTTIGLNAIDAEEVTDNGGSAEVFSRAVDGLRLGTKKLHYAHKYGVTRAISAPKYTSAGTHQGVSVGFRTASGLTGLEDGVVFAEDAAVHYTLDHASKEGSKSISNAVGALRRKLLAAVAAAGKTTTSSNDTKDDKDTDQFSETAYLRKVARGEMTLAITVHSADGIASVLKLKDAVDKAVAASNTASSGSQGEAINMVLVGGAEAYLLASELAEAKVGVVLAPLNSYRSTWDQRRALVGAPLNNGTAVEKLVGAGVVTAIGLEEDWLVRDMGLLAGIAAKNSGGVIGEKEALELVGGNIYKMLGLSKGKSATAAEKDEFVVFEGSPLEIGSRVRAVACGLGSVDVYEEAE